MFRALAIDDDPSVLRSYEDIYAEGACGENSTANTFYKLLQSDSETKTVQRRLDGELDTASSGEAGFQLVEQSLEAGRPYALIYLDMKMPNGWGGIETARKIRAIDQQVTFIIVTAYHEENASALERAIGCAFLYLSKPFYEAELVQMTRFVVEDWRQNRKLEASNKTKDDFLASMSHELRTPLTSIIGNSEYMQEQLFIPELKEIVRDIEVAGRAQLALVNDILDVSKIESGKFTVDELPYDFAELLSNTRKMVAVRAERTGAELKLEQKNREQYLLLGDSYRIGQILINLLGNAIKFTEKGEIVLTSWVEDEQLCISVRDTGIGMSPQEQEHLFQKFEQADSSISRRFGGSGLGLFISLQLANMMGGSIEAKSRLGAGSTFTLKLPYRPTTFAVSHATESGEALSTATQFQGRVLVAEDTRSLQLLERRMLEGLGLTVTVVGDGQEAIDAALNEPFDLILMDMLMPRVDGLEATRAIREGGLEVPIIAITANVMVKHRELFQQAGGDGLVAKPIEKDDLVRTLSQYLKLEGAESVADGCEPLVLLEWGDQYRVGHPLIDRQHQEVIALINQFALEVQKSEAPSYQIPKLLAQIERGVQLHFADEEALLEALGYEGLVSHTATHQGYWEQLSRLFGQGMSERRLYALARLLLEWTDNHILVEDMDFKALVQSAGLQEVEPVLTAPKQQTAKINEVVDDEMLSMFAEEMKKTTQELKQALDEQDWERIREGAHMLKGVGTPFGYPELTDMAMRVQYSVDEERLQETPLLTATLLATLEKIVLA